ncbi:MAG: hypothetical protein WDO16_13795 [Bacteroidota bacterium]
MKSLEYQFTELSHQEDFQYLGRVFGTEVINNTIHVPAHMGTGSIKRVHLSDGLQVVKWDTCLHRPLELIKIKSLPGNDKIFTLTYSFSPVTFY